MRTSRFNAPARCGNRFGTYRRSTSVTDLPTGAGCCLYGAAKDIQGRIVVPGHHQAAVSTFMNTNRQVFGNGCTASGTFLRRSAGIHSDNLTPGSFGLVCQVPDELSPAGVQDGLGESAPDHIRDVQIFDGDQLVLRNQPLTDVMSEVEPVVPQLPVGTLQAENSFIPSTATLLPATDPLVVAPKFASHRVQEARVLDGFPGAQRGEVKHAHVEADRRCNGNRGQNGLPILDDQLAEPLSCPVQNPLNLDSPIDGAKIAAANQAVNATDADPAISDTFARFSDGETVPAVLGLETGEARRMLALFQAAEERLEADIETLQGVTLDLDGDTSEIGFGMSPFGQMCGLGETTDALTGLLVGGDAFFKSAIEDVPADGEVIQQSPCLPFVRIQRDSHSQQHGPHLKGGEERSQEKKRIRTLVLVAAHVNGDRRDPNHV